LKEYNVPDDEHTQNIFILDKAKNKTKWLNL